MAGTESSQVFKLDLHVFSPMTTVLYILTWSYGSINNAGSFNSIAGLAWEPNP